MANKTILVGISGGPDSLVAAYLLKRQKYDVIGLSVLFSDEKESILSHNREGLKSFFKGLDVPYYQFQEQQRCQTKIVDLMISSRISGHLFRPQIPFSELLMETLISKMDQFKADKIATGHRIRMVYNHQTRSHELYRSKNISEDQSHLLAFLPQKYLDMLELPLVGMRAEDIEKIAKILNINPLPQKSCLEHTIGNFEDTLARKVPKDLCKEGEVIHHFSQCVVGTHRGLHHFSPGVHFSPKEIALRDESLSKKHLIPVQILPQRNQLVIMDKRKWVSCTHIIVSHCQYSSKPTRELPFEASLRIGTEHTFLTSAHIRLLNNSNVLCELKKPWEKPLFPGESVVVYGENEGGKVILGGRIFQAGCLYDGDRFATLPPTWEQKGHTKEQSPPPSSNISSFKF